MLTPSMMKSVKVFFGPIGMSNLLTVLLFDRVFSQSPNFSAMFYLRECIAWEKAGVTFLPRAHFRLCDWLLPFICQGMGPSLF